MPCLEPLIRSLEDRHSRPFVDDARPVQRMRRHPERLNNLRGTGPASLLNERGNETRREPTRMRGGHAGAAFDLIPGIPTRYGRERDSRRQDVGFRELPAARAEPAHYVTRRGCTM